MIEVGKYNVLRIDRKTEQGLYLEDEEKNDVLLPNRYIPEDWKLNDSLQVFVYNDSEDRLVATTLSPKINLNEFAVLQVKSISSFGAFADWGLPKDLLIPFSNQHQRLAEGDWVVVYLYLDEKTNRLAGTTKLEQAKKAPLNISEGEEVNLCIGHLSDLGYNVIINQQFIGMLYKNEIFQPVTIGSQLKGFVKKIRGDGKIDVSLQQKGFGNIEPNANKILEQLKNNKGKLTLTDNSSPEEIADRLQMSKKTFKKAVGVLYKQRKIRFADDGIYLLSE